MNDEILINKRSANATNNGFEFQYAAALLIYFKHISETLYFGIEKKNDIYLELKNGKKIYAQAKSSLDADRIAASHFSEIKDALKSFENQSSDAEKLITIFNYHQPFGNNDKFFYGGGYDIKHFSDLTSKTKKKIISIIENELDIDFKKLEFWYLRFEGEEKHNSLKNYLHDFLNYSGNFNVNVSSLTDCLLCLMMSNASSKEKMIPSELVAGVIFSILIKHFV